MSMLTGLLPPTAGEYVDISLSALLRLAVCSCARCVFGWPCLVVFFILSCKWAVRVTMWAYH